MEENKEVEGYNDKDIIQRHTVDKGFNAGSAFRELDAKCKVLLERVELLEATLVEYFQERQDKKIITSTTPKIELLK